jgi:hypothetical protein
MLHPLSREDRCFWVFRILVTFGIISPVFFFIVDGTLGSRWMGYSQRQDSISSLGSDASPVRELANALIFGVTGALILFYAIAVFIALFAGRRFVKRETELPHCYTCKKTSAFFFCLSIFVSAILVMVLSGVSVNSPGTADTQESMAHGAIAGTALALSGVVPNIILSCAWRGARDITYCFHIFSYLCLSGVIAFFVVWTAFMMDFGLYERLAFALSFVWQVIVAIVFIMLSCAQPCWPCTRRPLYEDQKHSALHKPPVRISNTPAWDEAMGDAPPGSARAASQAPSLAGTSLYDYSPHGSLRHGSSHHGSSHHDSSRHHGSHHHGSSHHHH